MNKVMELVSKFSKKAPQLKPYEWMIKHTPQKEWIDGQGVYLWLAFFFSEIGAGIYFISLFYNFVLGYIVGWLMTLILGGIIHMKYLGQPKNAWRILLKPKTSELSRGMWVIMIYAVLGFFQIAGSMINIFPWAGGVFYKILMAVICLMLIMHGFATMYVVRAIPSWHSSIVLPLSIISGIWVGSQFVEFFFTISGKNSHGLEVWSRVFLFVYICFIVMYLWSTMKESETAEFSIKELIKGIYSEIFYIGVVGIGIVIPLLLTLAMWSGPNFGLVFIRLVSVFLGDMILRYSIMKSAYYTPLVNPTR